MVLDFVLLGVIAVFNVFMFIALISAVRTGIKMIRTRADKDIRGTLLYSSRTLFFGGIIALVMYFGFDVF